MDSFEAVDSCYTKFEDVPLPSSRLKSFYNVFYKAISVSNTELSMGCR